MCLDPLSLSVSPSSALSLSPFGLPLPSIWLFDWKEQGIFPVVVNCVVAVEAEEEEALGGEEEKKGFVWHGASPAFCFGGAPTPSPKVRAGGSLGWAAVLITCISWRMYRT